MAGGRAAPVVIPSLRARDLAETIAFYSRLGFTVRAMQPCGGPAHWCELIRDSVRLHFHVMDLEGQSAEPALSGTLYIRVDDVRVLAEQWQVLTPFAWGPEVMPYGWREFAIRDPNGYTLGFFEETSDPPDCPDA